MFLKDMDGLIIGLMTPGVLAQWFLIEIFRILPRELKLTKLSYFVHKQMFYLKFFKAYEQMVNLANLDMF